MTVCVAALCDDSSTIIGASDRMLTSGTGDIEFEPPQTKIVNLTSSIAIMIAGDAILQTEIMLNVSDSIGFAAIGVGRGHASSQFMFAAHTRFRPGPETLLLAFSAKKRAEVAPGVGRDTDMFIIGPELGSSKSIGEHVLVSLERIYKTSQKKEQSARKKAEKSINEYLTQLGSEQTTKTQEASPASETVSGSGGTTERPNGPEKEDKENKP